jgi:hypothetical protein
MEPHTGHPQAGTRPASFALRKRCAAVCASTARRQLPKKCSATERERSVSLSADSNCEPPGTNRQVYRLPTFDARRGIEPNLRLLQSRPLPSGSRALRHRAVVAGAGDCTALRTIVIRRRLELRPYHLRGGLSATRDRGPWSGQRDSNPDELLGGQSCSPLHHTRLVLTPSLRLFFPFLPRPWRSRPGLNRHPSRRRRAAQPFELRDHAQPRVETTRAYLFRRRI